MLCCLKCLLPRNGGDNNGLRQPLLSENGIGLMPFGMQLQPEMAQQGMQTNPYNGGNNGVLQFILSDFDPASPHHGCFEGQTRGNHFTLGITVYGFKQALVITLWARYTRNPKHFADNTGNCWNIGDLNGYDVCEHIRAYMRKIGKPHLSLIEAIASGEVNELLCLQSEVGPADGFFSHVQAVAVTATVQSLEDAERMYEHELLEDRERIAALQQKTLEDFIQATAPQAVRMVPELLEKFSPAALENWCYTNWGRFPVLESITAKKQHTQPRYAAHTAQSFLTHCRIFT
jgi:hypothetical protein